MADSTYSFRSITPILRSFDEAKMREFYVGYIGCEITFEHRFGPEAPLYVGLRLGTCELHLSEHHGDCSPGARVRIQVESIIDYWEHLAKKQYRFSTPGEPQLQPWGDREMSIADPFGNMLTFFEAGS